MTTRTAKFVYHRQVKPLQDTNDYSDMNIYEPWTTTISCLERLSSPEDPCTTTPKFHYKMYNYRRHENDYFPYDS